MATDTICEGRRILICAPVGRDAVSVSALLQEKEYDTQVCANIGEIAELIDDTVGTILLTEEALLKGAENLKAALEAQPSWSDVPFVLLAAQRTGRTPNVRLSQLMLFDLASNSVVLERPLGRASLFSAVASAMRLRQKQFQMRDRLQELSDSEAALRVERQALDELNRKLESRVEERTAELQEEMARRDHAEEALRQAQKMEAVGQLTGGIAHDFNNMLTGIIGGINIAKRRISTGRLEDVDRFMDAATESAHRAAALIARLLAFSRRQTLDAKPLDVAAQLDSSKELLERTLPETIEIEIAVAPDVGKVVADANQLESALLNLAVNARDAMPEGGKLTLSATRIKIETRARIEGLKPGTYVVITVQDTGVGMPPEIIDKVFEPFFTTKPIGQGTGLGLSMIYGFAQQSGGTVHIDSKPDHGTTIMLYLPGAEGDHEEGPNMERTIAPEGQWQTVLLVEDDDSVRLLIAEVLAELSYKVLEAGDSDIAIPLLQGKHPIDLMVSDVGLPGMNGRQLAEIARQHRPELPILFVTGYAENAAMKASFLGTNMAMISKPFAVDALAAKISEMVVPKRSN